MEKHFLKICSMILVIVLLINMLPMNVFAEEFRESVAATPEETAEAIDTSEEHIVEEITEKRTEYTKEFLLSSGVHMATVYAEPVHYETDRGWEEIDNTLKTNPDGTYSNTEGIWDISLPQQLSGSESVTIEKDGYTLSFYMDGELNTAEIATYGRNGKNFHVKEAKKTRGSIQKTDWQKMRQAVEFEEMVPKKSKSRLTYADVYENTDIIYDLDSNMFKESIVLDSYSPTLQGYTYTLEVGDMIPVLEENGQITLYDKDRKNIVMVMPAPFLVDDAQVHSYDVQVQLTGSGSTYTLNYLLPAQWLAAEDRAWPVVLDPAVTPTLTTSNIKDDTVIQFEQNQANSPDKDKWYYYWGMIQAGYYGADEGISRAYLMYKDLPDLISSDVVIGATIRLYKPENSGTTAPVEVHKVNSTWDSTTLTWANKPAYNTNIEDFAIVKDANYYSWVVTDIVRDWYANKNTGMMFKVSDAIEAAKTDNYKQFCSSDYTEQNAYQPVLTIYFRNNNGLESYWDYTTSSAGRAGTGYVNNFTGNMTWIHNDIGFDGNRMPVSINHVYNLNDAYAVSDSNNSNDSGGNSFNMGVGWRTNYNQLVYKWSVDSSYYVWEDSDGTDHYFALKDGVYKDEDGLELTLTDTGSGTTKYCISDKNGNCSYFDTYGRLSKISNNQQTKSSINITYYSTTRLITCITDGIGRRYLYMYENGLLDRIEYMGSGSTVLSYVDFGYKTEHNTTRLSTITYKDGKTCSYTYSVKGLMWSATDVDGYKLSYTYNSGMESWQPYRVQRVSAADGTASGGSLDFSYAHNQTTLKDHNSNVQIMQFNDYGNTTCIQDSEGKAVYSQFAFNTSKEEKAVKMSDATAKSNQLRLSSDLQYTVSNLMADNNMREDKQWSICGNVEMPIDRDKYAIDTRSIYVDFLDPSETSERGIYYKNAFSLKAGETQTFSCLVASSSSHVYVKAVCGNKTVVSETVPCSINWQRMQVTYTNTTSATQQVKYYVVAVDGDGFHMDCPQLERSVTTASRYNAVNNGDFNQADSDYGWSRSGLSSTDGITTVSKAAAPQLDTHVYKITGSPTAAKAVKQTVYVTGGANASLTFSGWAKGNSAPLESSDTNPREFAIKAVINYKDETKSDPFYARFNPDTDQWQYAAGGMVAKKSFNSVTLYLVYDYNVNTVYFDGIQVNKDEFGSCYKYDDEGNVVSVVDSNSKETTYEYRSNNLTKEILSTGSELTYTYDSYHNVKTATTEEGLVYTFTYDAYGNNTKVSIAGNGKSMSSTAVYTSDGNRLVSTKDTLGKETKYSYNAQTNVLEWVQYPGDTADTRTEYTYDSMYRLVSAEGTTDTGLAMSADYTYADDLLTKIQTPTSTYHFAYGSFGLRTGVKVGSRSLATYSYTTDGNNYLKKLAYSNGDSVQYSYDDEGRVIKETYEDGETVTYTYSNSGNISTVTSSATGITGTYIYDSVDRLVRYTETGGDHDYLVRYTYYGDNTVHYVYENVTGGRDHNAEFTYDADDRITSYRKGNGVKSYDYDAFDRVGSTEVTHKGKTILRTDYTFTDPTSSTTSGQVASMSNAANGYSTTYNYTYDNNGNITSISDDYGEITYAYDSANQLVRENNQIGNYTYTWTYDNAGNILSRKEYTYTTGTLGTPTDTVTYTYGDSQWGDLLTAYDGQALTYDAVGNLTNDGTWTYSWKHGRKLDAMTDGEKTWDFTYGADGLRTKRTDGETTYDYIYYGGQLMYMHTDGCDFYFTYSPEGTPMGIVFNSTAYYYMTNLQGDVVAILNNSGRRVTTYTYDAWGNILTCTGSMASTLGTLNPLRYRGYVYDNETGLYYLQSRYYNPEVGRFINADRYAATGQGFIGNNMFAYCLNNPVNFVDYDGEDPEAILASWAGMAGWLLVADGPAPIGDAIVALGFAVIAVVKLAEGADVFVDLVQHQTTVAQNATAILTTDTDAKEETTLKVATLKKGSNQAYFTFNPFDFSPRGLCMVVYPGSYNGRIIKWVIPQTGACIFEWNEDFSNGSHYHVMKVEWQGNHYGLHFLPGTPVPEPWNTLYFGG